MYLSLQSQLTNLRTFYLPRAFSHSPDHQHKKKNTHGNNNNNNDDNNNKNKQEQQQQQQQAANNNNKLRTTNQQQLSKRNYFLQGLDLVSCQRQTMMAREPVEALQRKAGKKREAECRMTKGAISVGNTSSSQWFSGGVSHYFNNCMIFEDEVLKLTTLPHI